MKELQRTSDVVPQQLDKRFTSEMLWNKVKWRCPKEHAEEVKDMIFRGETMGKVMLHVKSLQK